MYKIVITKHFKKSLKALVKKNLQLKEDLKKALISFDKSRNIQIGKGIFKLRLASLNKGKSGGYRLYVFLMELEGVLTPLHIYEKSNKENITTRELIMHLESVQTELRELL